MACLSSPLLGIWFPLGTHYGDVQESLRELGIEGYEKM